MKKNSTYKLAFSSVMAALCFVFLFLGSVITVLDLSSAALTSIILILCVIEAGGFYPWLVWAVVSLISLLLLPDKFGALVFCAFTGYYPMLKGYIERLPRPLHILKLVIFNIALTAIIFISNKLLGLPETEITYSVTVYLVCNAVFILYDIAMTRMLSFYIIKLRNRFKFLRKR